MGILRNKKIKFQKKEKETKKLEAQIEDMQKEKVKILEKQKKTEENNSKNIQDMETKQNDKLSELNQQKSEIENELNGIKETIKMKDEEIRDLKCDNEKFQALAEINKDEIEKLNNQCDTVNKQLQVL